MLKVLHSLCLFLCMDVIHIFTKGKGYLVIDRIVIDEDQSRVFGKLLGNLSDHSYAALPAVVDARIIHHNLLFFILEKLP